MAIDTTTPRSRRALLFGALGGAIATAAAVARPAATRAGVDGDLVLEEINTTDAQTELQSTTSAAGLRVLSSGIGLQGWGDIGVDAYGTTIAVNAVSDGTSAPGVVGWNRANSLGQLGWSTDGNDSTPTVPAKTGVYGLAAQDAASRGVIGKSPAGQGVRGEATGGTGVAAVSDSGPAMTADSATGLAVRATSTGSHGIKGRGQVDGVVGESPGGRSGVVGYSGGGSAPAGPAKTGVYGEATQDTASRGVSGFSLAGQGVRGEATSGQGVQGVATTGQGVRGDTTGGTGAHGQATTGVGVRAVATTGVALAVSGRATFSRSGKVTVPIGVTFIDVTVPGGLASSAIAFATLQYLRSGVYVMGARPNHPSAGKLRIYLSKALATATPVAWFVIG